jgi:hypothetical protein
MNHFNRGDRVVVLPLDSDEIECHGCYAGESGPIMFVLPDDDDMPDPVEVGADRVLPEKRQRRAELAPASRQCRCPAAADPHRWHWRSKASSDALLENGQSGRPGGCLVSGRFNIQGYSDDIGHHESARCERDMPELEHAEVAPLYLAGSTETESRLAPRVRDHAAQG